MKIQEMMPEILQTHPLSHKWERGVKRSLRQALPDNRKMMP